MEDPVKGLEKLLGKLGGMSQFAASGQCTPVLPGLEAKDVGPIGVPVSPADAKRLIKRASQAPYGRGEETIVDTKVRRVWQLEPAQFSLSNPDWATFLKGVVDAVRKELGIDAKVKHELYKLLIYEKGSFFAPHRDTEKISGMFGTLVVCLPSNHEGGALVIEHDGQTKRIETGGVESQFKIQYAAFYADCRHEILPIKKGHRVTLVYNLAVAKAKQPSAPQNNESVLEVAKVLKSWFAKGSKRGGLFAFPLEHQYTAAGLHPHELKGNDRARTQVLARAAESQNCHCHLALMTLHQSGSPDYYAPPSRGRGWGRRDWDNYNDEDDPDASGMAMEEIFDEDLWLDHWVAMDGTKQRLGEMHVADELLMERASQGPPVEQQYHEATGNEGATLERWYHRAVVVIWPQRRFFRIVSSQGPAVSVPFLKQKMADARSPESRRQCRKLAAQIVAHWRGAATGDTSKSSLGRTMLNLLHRMSKPALMTVFVSQALPTTFTGAENDAILKVCERFGWDVIGPALRQLLAAQPPKISEEKLKALVDLCELLCTAPGKMTSPRRAACIQVIAELEELVQRCDKGRIDASWMGKENSRAAVVSGAMHAMGTLGEDERLNQFVMHVLGDPRRYDLRKTLAPAVLSIAGWIKGCKPARPAYGRLREHVLGSLRSLASEVVEPPPDWRREDKLKCQCEHCRRLSMFLRDPGLQVLRLPLRKELRQHLHQEIDRHGCDLTHVTERKGSPQTLVCTKTRAAYEKRLAQLQSDRKLLELLGDKPLKAQEASTKPKKFVRKPAARKMP